MAICPLSAGCYWPSSWLTYYELLQATNKLPSSKRASQTENMDNFRALYISYVPYALLFLQRGCTPHPRAYGSLVFFLTFCYKLMLFDFWVKDRRRNNV